MTKISSNDVGSTFFEGSTSQVDGVDYSEIDEGVGGQINVNLELLNVGWYRNSRGQIPNEHIKHYLLSSEHGGLSGQNPFETGNDTVTPNPNFEHKQYYFHPDHLGSSNYLTDALGEVYQHVEYLPFGETFLEERNTQQDRNTYLYNGKELDEETGLYYYGARFYDAQLARWHVVDLLAEKGYSISPYVYTFNNPIKFIDPDGNWPWPNLIAGMKFESIDFGRSFGYQRHPILGTKKFHSGVDMTYNYFYGGDNFIPNGGALNEKNHRVEVQIGQKVRAAARGKVIANYFSWNGTTGYGNIIEIDHGNGFTSRYAHLNKKPDFKIGDWIDNGQTIGEIGTTGGSTKPHLHFEIRKNNKAIDPVSIYDLDELLQKVEGLQSKKANLFNLIINNPLKSFDYMKKYESIESNIERLLGNPELYNFRKNQEALHPELAD